MWTIGLATAGAAIALATAGPDHRWLAAYVTGEDTGRTLAATLEYDHEGTAPGIAP